MTPTHSKSAILVVDDNVTNLKLAIEYLQAYSFEILTARNGETALIRAQEARPDLILLDVQMPGLSGLETCRRLKANPQTAHIPVIFMTALSETEDKVRGLEAGGVDYITKPFQIEEVLARVRTHLSLEALRQKLRAQNAQLQEQNQELDAFASTVAHDLKNPLTSITASLKLMNVSASKLDAEMQELIGLGVNAAVKMDSIINELLLLATVRKEEVAPAPVNMRDVVEQALARLKSMLAQYHPEVITPATWPSAQGYAPWLEEIWANYLSNGLKYGGRPPRLELGATAQPDGTIRFWVQDNGPGLSPAEQAKLFTEFTRLDKVRAQGHGLGLSIVRRIADKLGGQAGVESAPGQGSRFYFALPASR